MSRDSILEIQHKREQSHDSGTYQDWTLEETFPQLPVDQCKNSDFVTVVAVDEKPFVTVLSVDSSPPDSEEVLVYRLPGERLGFGLKFEGGVKSAEKVKKLLIQSCADDSPASRTRASWGPLSPGDEILVIDSVPVSEMTRMDCVRALKESNVVIKLRVRKAVKAANKEEDKEAPPIPPRKFPRKKELLADGHSAAAPQDEQKNSPPVQPRSRQVPQAELYTDLISQENVLPGESESDDTGSSISTVVSRISSTPTTCNSSFSDARSTNSVDFPTPSTQGVNQTTYDLDKVLEPFLHLEREFSSATLHENNIFHKLAEATNLIESSKAKEDDMNGPPKPAPRQDRRRPPPPPPPPRTDKQPVIYQETRHLPRLIDFVPKDRTDVVVPSPLVPQPHPNLKQLAEEIIPKDEAKEQIKEIHTRITDSKKIVMDAKEVQPKPTCSSQKEKLPSTFSKQLYDGHEQPAQDKNIGKIGLPSLKTSPLPVTPFEPKSKPSYNIKKNPGESHKFSWRNDEKSEKSVKDKIAMFSNVQAPTQPVVSRKLIQNKIPKQDVVDHSLPDNEIIEKNPKIKLLAKGSAKFQSLHDVSGGVDTCKNSLLKDEKTQSTLNLSETDGILSKDGYSTLPRTTDSSIPREAELLDEASGTSTLSGALSFSGEPKLHSRSQSLIDVGYKNALLKQRDELRKSSLTSLAEARKKGYSKLRGLVIPEKVAEVPTTQVVVDLPVIKSKDCLIAKPSEQEKQQDIAKPECDKVFNSKPLMDKGAASLLPSSLWQAETSPEIPKYSPAFKRKSLSLYGTTSSVSSVSSSLSSSREELRTCFHEPSKTLTGATHNITRSLAGLARNPISSHSEPKSLESITSPSMSDVSYDYAHESISPNSNSCSDSAPTFKYNEGYSSDSQRSKAEEREIAGESDNDSAVSSSRSSISPANSPMPDLKKTENITPPPKTSHRYDLKLKRTLSTETNASNSSCGSTLRSASRSSSTSSSVENKRVLKPQSVEAINRKNVLSSAKFSSGTDSKAETTDGKTEIKDVEGIKTKTEEHEPNISSDKSECSPIKNDHKKSDEQDTKMNNFPLLKETYQHLEDGNGFKTNINSNEPIKHESPSSIDDFVYTTSKRIDTNSNLKNNDFNDIPEKISFSDKPQVDIKPYERQKNDDSSSSPKAINVSTIKKVFEKVDNSYLPPNRFKMNINNQNGFQHPRVSSVDSTNSDDSCVPHPSHYGSATNLQKEQQYGSITSLASSTSLISQQELALLIDEANHTLEDEGNSQEVIVVLLYRDLPNGSVGITLAGGADHEVKEITVHKVLIGSPADRDGRIQKGDRILSINGRNVKGLAHLEAVAILKAPRPEVVLVVSRHIDDPNEENLVPPAPQPRNTSVRMNRFSDVKSIPQSKGKESNNKWGPSIKVKVRKDGAGLGFSLEGGKDSPNGDLPLTIKKVFTGGRAEKTGSIFAGDELLAVNEIDVSSLSRIEAWSIMKKIPDGEVLISVRHPAA